MDIKEINSAIMFGNLTNAELESVINAVKYARSQLVQEKKRSFAVGDRVKFNSVKRGITVVGTVKKIAIKYITVAENGNSYSQWKVPANMLESI